jgi:putative transport protein
MAVGLMTGMLAEAAATQAARPDWVNDTLSTLPTWFERLLTTPSVGHVVLVLCLVAVLGLFIGTIKVRGISLGIGGVLFSGIAMAHFFKQWGLPLLDAGGDPKNWHVLHFVQEFGLILFVYTVGVQVGPSFFSNLRREGLRLNMMAAAIVLLGAVTAVLIFKFANVPLAAAVGLFSGATTNTPSLQAAAEALKMPQVGLAADVPMQGNAYAMAYPFGILGIILTMLLIRFVYRVSLERETEDLHKAQESHRKPLVNLDIEVKHINEKGLALCRLPECRNLSVTISRVLKGEKVLLGLPNVQVMPGDVLHVVGPKEGVDRLCEILGEPAKVDVLAVHSPITYRKVLVTQGEYVGKTVEELELRERFNVNVTRILRGDLALSPSSGVRIAYGDTLGIVGEEDDVNEVASALGNSIKALNHPQIIPIFVAIAIGIMVGSWTINVGLPAPVRLGLAGGPLVAAILLSRLSKFGPLIWYLPLSANLALREIGIVLFLACVGLNCGGEFWRTIAEGDGLRWMAFASLITVVPILLVGLVGRSLLKINYLTLCGVLSGSMTDPPALQFAGQVTQSEAPSVAYSTVYPLTMIMRIFIAQLIVLLFAGG